MTLYINRLLAAVPAVWRPFVGPLAALTLFYIVDGLQVRIGLQRDTLRLGIDAAGWALQDALGPLLFALGGLAVLGLAVRQGRLRPMACVRPLQALVWLSLGLTAAKTLSLAAPVGGLLPHLGLLWSPHASWALALVYAGLPLLLWPRRQRWPRHRTIAGLLLAVALPLYGFYTLYTCQMMLIHGDEGQYLAVTQSLLRDGDIDLADTQREDLLEFHLLEFDLHEAPASPPGKVYPLHPVGLSVLIIPAYEWGHVLWDNPRLGAALLMALLAALCLPLAYLWLVRLDIGPGKALAATVVMGTTAPFFWFVPQLYPDLPALFIVLLLLLALAHWQRPEGGYRPWGLAHLPLLGLGTVLLGLLPFLHPRFLALAAPLGILLLLQAWHGPRRLWGLAFIGGLTAAAGGALLAFNLHYSGDWLGPFRPGNAWDREALQPSMWPVALPGHWVNAAQGLLNSAPVFLLCLPGWAWLAARRDRRLAVAAALYLCTAAVNGLHPIWTFGYCYPARFLLVSLPALLLGLSATFGLIRRRPGGLWALAVLLFISWGTVVHSWHLPEAGITGRSLPLRPINYYLPIDLLFARSDTQVPVAEALFWTTMAALLSVLWWKRRWPRPLVAGLVAGLFLLPVALLKRPDVDRRLAETVPAMVPPLDTAGRVQEKPRQLGFSLANTYQVSTGHTHPDSGHSARQDRDPPGILHSYYMPLLQPGIYHLRLPDAEASGADGPSGQLVTALRHSVPASGPWGTRRSVPLQGSGGDLVFLVERPTLGYTFVEYNGRGTLSFAQNQVTYLTQRLQTHGQPIHRFDLKDHGGATGRIAVGATHGQLPPGFYRVEFAVAGQTAGSLFERVPDPVGMAVFAVPTGTATAALDQRLGDWLNSAAKMAFQSHEGIDRPMIEVSTPPWRLLLPGASAHFAADFQIGSPSDLWFLIRYSGDLDLRAEAITLSRRLAD